MNIKTIKYTPTALRSLNAIIDYTEKQWGKKQAEKYSQKFYSRFKYLAENSSLGRKCDYISPNLRSYPESSHVIYYKIGDLYIEITDVLHKSMDAEYNLNPENIH